MANIVEIVLHGKDRVTGPLRNASRSMRDFRTVALAMSKVAAVAFAAATGAVTALTVAAARNAEEISNMARAVGFSVEPFSRLVFVAELFGIKINDLRVGINAFNKRMVEASTRVESQAAKAFESLGVAVTDANGKIRDNNEVMREVADRMATFRDGAQKSALALFLFSDVGARMIPFLNQGAEGMDRLGQGTRGVSEETAKAASEFQANLFRMRQALLDIGTTIIEDVGPQIGRFSSEIVSMQEQTKIFSGVATATTTTALALARGFAALGFVLGQLRIELRAVGEILGSTFIEALHGVGLAIRNQLRIFSDLGNVISLTLSGQFSEAGKAAGAAVRKSLGVDLVEQIKETGAQIIEDTKKILDDTERDLEARKTRFEQFLRDLAAPSPGQAIAQGSLSTGPAAPTLSAPGSAGGASSGGGGGAAGADAVDFDDFEERSIAIATSLQQTFGRMREDIALTYAEVTNGGLAMLDATRNLLHAYGEIWRNSLFNVKAAFTNFAADIIAGFSEAFSNTVANVVTGAQKASEAFKALGTQMVAALVKFITQLAVNTAIATALQGTMVAATAAAISPILASWTAAATAASIATLGSATAFAATVPAAQAANVAFAQGLSVVGGAAHGGLDFVPSEKAYLLDRGERVLSPSQNRDFTEFINVMKQGGGGGGPVHVVVNLDGRPIIDTVADASRDGRLTISGRSVRS